ncbi:MAG: twin-arginine translocase TatA/TatE family subunit [Planctomycetes bacterium]|nr:twin-arginine translocase TatA/TatE family subunit [Planctomycetota bacterium]
MIAFLPSLGFPEMVILVILGLLLYGRNLPEAGRAMGKVAAQFRRGFQDFKDQLDREGDLRDMKKTLQNTAQELKRVAEVPRAGVDPNRVLRDLTNEALSSPVPPEPATPSTTPPPPAAVPRSPEPPA